MTVKKQGVGKKTEKEKKLSLAWRLGMGNIVFLTCFFIVITLYLFYFKQFSLA